VDGLVTPEYAWPFRRERSGVRGWDESIVQYNFADLEEVRLHYVQAGEGPLVVLVHGFPEF
jgi:hypothetical protein